MSIAEPLEEPPPPPVAAGRRTRTIWGTVIAVIAVGFVVVVVTSTAQDAVVVGGMGGMQMQDMGNGSGMQMSIRDVDGRAVRVPDGRPGVAVFVTPANCAACADAVRAAERAVRRARQSAQLLVVGLDSATSRRDIAAFARTAGSPGARYVIDDRNGSLASMFKVTAVGGAVVYDATGKIVGHPASAAQIGQILARALPPAADRDK